MKTTRVAVLTDPRRFAIERRPPPSPADDEIVVSVSACAICGSDLKMYSGTHAFLRPPLVMGHEVVGSVERVGQAVDESLLAGGEQIAVFPPVGCGHCFHCARGQPQLCEEMEFYGGQRHGGLAEQLLVPAANALPIPATVPAEHRIFIEPLSVAIHGVKRGYASRGETALVLGAGAIGLFTALVLREQGVGPILIADLADERLARAASLGFETVNPSAVPLRNALRERIRPEGADVVFECVGTGATIAQALALARKGGRAVIVGNAPRVLELDGLALQRGDRSLVGVLMYDREDFVESMQLLAGGLLSQMGEEELVDGFALEEVAAAFETAASRELAALRVVVKP